MKFFYLFVFIYASNAIPLTLKDDILAEKAADTNQSTGLLASLKSNPKQFVADMQNLDPAALQRVITLLEDLKASSEAKETNLIDDLNVKNTALDQANARVVQKENDVDNANNAVGDANNALSAAQQAAHDAITAAQGVLTGAQHAATSAETDLTNERTAQAAVQAEKDASKTTHDDEIPTLNEEQRVLTEVINMLNGLPDANAPDSTSSSTTGWFEIKQGEICSTKCSEKSLTCNAEKALALSTYDAVAAVWKELGIDCFPHHGTSGASRVGNGCYWLARGHGYSCDWRNPSDQWIYLCKCE